MPPKFFWEITGAGLAIGLVIWFFGKRPAYVIAGDPTITYHASGNVPDSTTSDVETNGGQQ